MNLAKGLHIMRLHDKQCALQVQGDIATWYREIDFEPPGKPDVGRMTFVTPDILHEDDPDASSAAYHETWERVPGTREPSQCWGFRLAASEEGSQRSGFLLAAGDRFMFAADRVRPLPAGAGKSQGLGSTSAAFTSVSLSNSTCQSSAGATFMGLWCTSAAAAAVLTAGTMREIIGSSRAQEEKVELLGFEVSYGSTCAWTIELSTLPQQRGATLLKGEASSLSSAKLKSVLEAGTPIHMGGIMPHNGWRASLPKEVYAKA